MTVLKFCRWGITSAMIAAACLTAPVAAKDLSVNGSRSIAELRPEATIHLGKNADWVAITADSVWVGSKGPNAVHRIDPRTNQLVATVLLPGNPCAGITVGFGGLWVPLCATPNGLARVDLRSHAIRLMPGLGPAAEEGGIATSSDSVWLVVDVGGWLARIDPGTGAVRQKIRIPPGSYNPVYSDGRIWVTRADGAEITIIRADTGEIAGRVPSGPGPRFATAGGGAVWTLNQGDGSVTRVSTGAPAVAMTVALGIPGPGGDIAYGAGRVWATVVKVPLSVIDPVTSTLLCQWTGPGGDSLSISQDAIWLTDFGAGTVSRFNLNDTVARCEGALHH
jgi:streptogramin lyase